MADVGYQYVNIDDCWTNARRTSSRPEPRVGPFRDAQGNILPNKYFPDMKALTDYIHSNGLKAGIYTSPGPLTCCGFAGSLPARGAGRQAVRRLGFRFPEVRLVLLWQHCRGQERPANAAEALHSDGRAAERATPRHRLQPLPVRHGRRLEVGRRGRRAELANRRRPGLRTALASSRSP